MRTLMVILAVLAATGLAAAQGSRAAAPDSGAIVMLDCWFNNEWRASGDGGTARYHYVWDDTTNSGFSQLGSIIISLGVRTRMHCDKPTDSSLEQADLFIIVDPDTRKESPEPHAVDSGDVQTIVRWVRGGGVLVLLGNDSGNCNLQSLNRLSAPFGILFNDVCVNRVTGKDFSTGTFDVLPRHPIFEGVERIFIKELSTLQIREPAMPVFVAEDSSVIMAAARMGEGFVFALGDPWLYNEYMDARRLPPEYHNARAARNLFAWLLGERRTL